MSAVSAPLLLLQPQMHDPWTWAAFPQVKTTANTIALVKAVSPHFVDSVRQVSTDMQDNLEQGVRNA